MNYATEAIEHILQDAKAMEKYSPSLAAAFRQVAKDLRMCPKFAIPSPEQLNVKATKTCLPFVRLPYPVCAFEYGVSHAHRGGIYANLETEASTKRIALAYDITYDSEFVATAKLQGDIKGFSKGIAVVSIFHSGNTGRWCCSVGYGIFETNLHDLVNNITSLKIDEQVRVSDEAKATMSKLVNNLKAAADSRDDMLIDNTQQRFQLVPVPFMKEKAMDADKLQQIIVNDVGTELATVICMCMMLNAKNLKQVQIVQAPKFLNRKRLAKGKVPFFDYHTIDVFVSDSQKLASRRLVTGDMLKTVWVKNAPGMHSVMGHMKVRASGVYWWNPHLRGDANKGFIDKDYVVIPKGE